MRITKWPLAFLCACICVGSSLSAAQDAASKMPLENTYWKLTYLNGIPVSSSSREPYLMFSLNPRRVAGSGGCNRLTGNYQLKGNRLTFSQMASTRMACPKGMVTENAFLAALGRVKNWKASGQQLELFDQAAKPLCRFEARPTPPEP